MQSREWMSAPIRCGARPGMLAPPHDPGSVCVLELENLKKRFGDVTALDGVSFSVEPGTLMGFLGPNGAGKTTAMRSVFGLVALDDGTVSYDGHVITDEDLLRFGYMPEQRGLYPTMKVGEQLDYIGVLHGMTRSDAASATRTLLEELDLGDRINSKVQELSHGNQQRVQLAAALVHDPEVLILDEPFSGLDPIGVAAMEDVLRERAAAGSAVVFSSHQLDLVEGLCERVVIIENGRMALSGTIDELRSASPRRRLDISLGPAAATWSPVGAGIEVVARNGTKVSLSVPLDVDLSDVLEQARQVGTVSAFTFEPPTLSQVFRSAVGISGGVK
jgi:ABC-2 type transport system ATP-binding protein